MAILRCSTLIFAAGAFQAKAHHLRIVRPFLSSVRQLGNDPLDLVTLCRILDRSSYGFKISKKTLFVVVHDTSLGKLLTTLKMKDRSFHPCCHKKSRPALMVSGILSRGFRQRVTADHPAKKNITFYYSAAYSYCVTKSVVGAELVPI